jgi:broad specificity phosphatase PhoE
MKRPHLAPLLAMLALADGCAAVGTPRVIYLARHGQTAWNRVGRFQGDPDLDAVGYVNRFSLWQLLKEQPIEAIYVSERQRTQRTAALLARQHGLVLEVRAALNEIASGVLEGICWSMMAPARARSSDRACEVRARGSRPEVTAREIARVHEATSRDRLRGRFPLAESVADVAARTRVFVEELRRGHHEREVLVVGHGVVNRVLLHHLMGWPLEAVEAVRQENDQVYRLETDGARVLKLSLYTPGAGWRECRAAPAAGQRSLDCSPAEETPPSPPASRPR